MNIEQIKEVVSKYSEFLDELEAHPKRIDEDLFINNKHIYPCYNHLKYMAESILNGEITGEKAHRWLGFMQGVLWSMGDYSLAELKIANRTKE